MLALKELKLKPSLLSYRLLNILTMRMLKNVMEVGVTVLIVEVEVSVEKVDSLDMVTWGMALVEDMQVWVALEELETVDLQEDTTTVDLDTLTTASVMSTQRTFHHIHLLSMLGPMLLQFMSDHTSLLSMWVLMFQVFIMEHTHQSTM